MMQGSTAGVALFELARYYNDKLAQIVRNNFDARPAKLIAELDLLRPIYSETAAYGHFGREGFSWEKTDKASSLG